MTNCAESDGLKKCDERSSSLEFPNLEGNDKMQMRKDGTVPRESQTAYSTFPVKVAPSTQDGSFRELGDLHGVVRWVLYALHLFGITDSSRSVSRNVAVFVRLCRRVRRRRLFPIKKWSRLVIIKRDCFIALQQMVTCQNLLSHNLLGQNLLSQNLLCQNLLCQNLLNYFYAKTHEHN